jgi:transposase
METVQQLHSAGFVRWTSPDVRLWFNNNQQRLDDDGTGIHRKKVRPEDLGALHRAFDTAPEGMGARDVETVARALGFGAPARVAQRLIRDDFNRTFAFLHPERERRWSPEHIKHVRKIIKQNPTMTLQAIIQKVTSEHDAPSISNSTLAHYMATELLTYKTVTRQNQMRNAAATKALRREYVLQAKARTQAGRTKVFNDETGYQIGLHNSHGRASWAPAGELAITTAPRSDGRNESVFSGVCGLHGLVYIEHRSGAYKANTFELAFGQLVRATMELGMTKVVFVGDNCRIHQKESLPGVVRAIIAEATQAALSAGRPPIAYDYQIQFLSPYTPMLNPLELSFKDFKHGIKALLDGPLHERMLEVIQQPWGQQTVARATLLHDCFEIAKDEITRERVYAHEQHATSLFKACEDEEDV